jgi:long-chain acyl-CoA synthetase
MTRITPISTINDLFLRVAGAGNPRAVLWQDEFGQWQPISSDQVYQRVRALAEAFLGWGARQGDRIGLIAENRWEWMVTDFASLAIGAANVPIYPTLTDEQVAGLLKDAGCRIAVVSTRAQFDKLQAVRAKTDVEKIVMMDPAIPSEGAVSLSSLLAGADEKGSSRDAVFDELVRRVEPKDLATLIYTSGTTGEPKGVMLTHGNVASNQNTTAVEFGFNETDSCISFLPLSHITARALDYVMYNHGAQVAYCSQFDKLPQAMKEVRPTVIVGVPRVYEIGGVAGEEAGAQVGGGPGRQARGYGVRRAQARFRDVEAGEQALLFEGDGGFWGPGAGFRVGRRAAWGGYGKVVCFGGHCAVGGVWIDGDLAGDRAEQPGEPPDGNGGQDSVER